MADEPLWAVRCIVVRQTDFLLQAPLVSVRRSVADAKDCVEMLKLPKDISLYSFKINSGSSDSLLPVVVSDILLSKQRWRCSINTRVYLEEFLAENEKSIFCGRYTDAYRFTASTLFLCDNRICFAHLFLCFTCG